MKILDSFVPEDNTGKMSFERITPGGDIDRAESIFLTEHELTVIVDERPAFRLICTACDLVNLVVGRLISEGVVECGDDIESVFICEKGNRAKVFLKEDALVRAGINGQGPEGAVGPVLPTVATCCTDNTDLLSSGVMDERYKRKPGSHIASPSRIFRLAESFAHDTALHKGTGGTHSALLMHGEEVVYGCEDIGRHNALDKAVGEMIIRGYDPGECIIFTTGRVPLDMVKKAIRSGISALVSKSVPTLQAVTLAKEYGLGLYFRTWPDSFDRA